VDKWERDNYQDVTVNLDDVGLQNGFLRCDTLMPPDDYSEQERLTFAAELENRFNSLLPTLLECVRFRS
jgi:hypothetical protein